MIGKTVINPLSKKEKAVFRALCGKHGRKNNDLCVCEGLRCCAELYSLRPDIIVKAFNTKEFDKGCFPGLAQTEISESDMKQISRTMSPQSIIFLTKKPELKIFEGRDDSPFVLLLDRISDPGNLGTIIRTARAAGLKSIFISSCCADPFTDKVIRAASASQFALDIFKFDNLNSFLPEILRAGYEKIYLSSVSQGKNIFEEEKLFSNSIIVIGNEASGVSSFVIGDKITIPMPGKTESLNVSQAAAVILFEAVRRGVL
jgi:TrmH family RNA methyltransferase